MFLSSDPSDAALMAAMDDGLDTMEVLYERYNLVAYSIARRITGDAALAEDVVQETFLTIWRNAARYDPTRGSVKTWLMAVVHHRAIDAIRRRKPTVDLPSFDALLAPHLQSPDAWDDVSAHLDAEEVRGVMGALSDAQRVAIELAYFGGCTQAEIARRTSTPLGTVKSRIRGGLLAMRAAMPNDARPGTGVGSRATGI